MKYLILTILVILSIKSYTQDKEFIYKNAEFGIEAKFPKQPVEYIKREKDLVTINTTSSLFLTAGISYSLTITKENTDIKESIKPHLFGNVKNSYQVRNKKVIETEMSMMGNFLKSKIIEWQNINVKLEVSSNSAIQDKDLYPFFNSIKIDDEVIQNPISDNIEYKDYSINYFNKTKPDTIKQIVYVNSDSKNRYKFEKLSDVDKNIPQNIEIHPNRFALIIGNEDYASIQQALKIESNVEFARNDASAFKEYCINTLGVPEKNITFLLDATGSQINQGITKLKLLSKATNGKSQLIFYYAGHGLPDENTKEPYLMPIDVSGVNVTSGIRLQDLYSNLTEFPTERVSFFLDACFTGGGRNAGLIASRGVKVKPKEGALRGNIIVYLSSSEEQSSLSYPDQKHGIFTYYLLKKLQETKGDLTYSELISFIQEKVSVESILVNAKEQNPVVNTSSVITEQLKSWKIK